ncbi:MAG: hypothetical protein QOH25_137 [Acidobacteriota bacterium]|nr:hypothetical protein [Acidobacteriota bacterium]
MRRTPAFFVLVIVATISFGCSKSDQGSTANTNAPGTTTYNTSAPSGTGGGATTTAPRQTQSNSNSPGEPKIKPPTDK